jgi:hypothetical protein
VAPFKDALRFTARLRRVGGEKVLRANARLVSWAAMPSGGAQSLRLAVPGGPIRYAYVRSDRAFERVSIPSPDGKGEAWLSPVIAAEAALPEGTWSEIVFDATTAFSRPACSELSPSALGLLIDDLRLE